MRPTSGPTTNQRPIEIPWEGREADSTDHEPLSQEERSALDRIARRLHGELRSAILALPEPARGASGMARHLGVERTTCQRIVSGVSGPFPGPELVTRLPGVQGLRRFVASLREGEDLDDSSIDSVEAAVDRFAEGVRTMGPSRSKLLRRMRTAHGSPPATPGDADGELAQRTQLFESGRRLTGQYSEVSLATFAFRPTPGEPGLMDSAQLRGFLGHHVRRDAMPFSFLWFSDMSASEDPGTGSYSTLEREPVKGRSQGLVLPEFSSEPLPVITSRGPGNKTVFLVDPKEIDPDRPIDVVAAGRTDAAQRHPAGGKPPLHEVWMLGRFPAKRLIFDVLLHRSMARACIPSVGVYSVQPNLAETQELRWLDRFPVTPKLEVLQPGIANIAHAAYPRYTELLGHLFDRLGWDAGEFIGYRCDVVYPVWGGGHCMIFDFGREEEDAG